MRYFCVKHKAHRFPNSQFTELNRYFERLAKQVYELKLNNFFIHNKLNSFKTRLEASEKILSEAIIGLPSSTSTNTPSLNDNTYEIQLRSQCVKNIIILGALKSLYFQASKRMSGDLYLVQIWFQKLEPPVPLASICKVFRIGKNNKTNLKVVLVSNNNVHRMILPFIRLRSTSLNHFTNIFISRDHTISERQSIRETYELRTKRDQGVANITIRYTNGFPRIVPATSHQKSRQHVPSHSKN